VLPIPTPILFGLPGADFRVSGSTAPRAVRGRLVGISAEAAAPEKALDRERPTMGRPPHSTTGKILSPHIRRMRR
jgi:hypothetical protein